MMSIVKQAIQESIVCIGIPSMSDEKLRQKIDEFEQHPVMRMRQALLIEADRRKNAAQLG